MQDQPESNASPEAAPSAMPPELVEALQLYRAASRAVVEASGRLLKAQGNADILALVADNRFRTAEISVMVELLERVGITTRAEYFTKVAEQLDLIESSIQKQIASLPTVKTAIHMPGSRGPRNRN